MDVTKTPREVVHDAQQNFIDHLRPKIENELNRDGDNDEIYFHDIGHMSMDDQVSFESYDNLHNYIRNPINSRLDWVDEGLQDQTNLDSFMRSSAYDMLYNELFCVDGWQRIQELLNNNRNPTDEELQEVLDILNKLEEAGWT